MKSWVSRFRSHFSSKTAANKNPTAALEALERWSARAAFIILVGIVLEAWETIHFQKPTESNGEVVSILIADAAVGVGLIIEIVCILRAIVETRREKRESDLKVAEANKAAQEARLEAERLRRRAMPRHLEFIKFCDELKGKPSAEFQIIFDPNEADCHFLQAEITLALQKSGWRSVANPTPRASLAAVGHSGIWLIVDSLEENSPDWGARRALEDAFLNASVNVRITSSIAMGFERLGVAARPGLITLVILQRLGP